MEKQSKRKPDFNALLNTRYGRTVHVSVPVQAIMEALSLSFSTASSCALSTSDFGPDPRGET
jgi:hypothetical protein